MCVHARALNVVSFQNYYCHTERTSAEITVRFCCVNTTLMLNPNEVFRAGRVRFSVTTALEASFGSPEPGSVSENCRRSKIKQQALAHRLGAPGIPLVVALLHSEASTDVDTTVVAESSRLGVASVTPANSNVRGD